MSNIIINPFAFGAVSAFVSTWKTDNTSAGSSGVNEVTIPTVADGDYNCVVDWGDDSTPDVITTFNDAKWTHDYTGQLPAPPATYTITITGTFTGILFNDGGDKLKILTISSWGIFKLGDAGGGGLHFFGCANIDITATDTLDADGCTSLASSFRDTTSATAFAFDWANLGSVGTASSCFRDSSITAITFAGWENASSLTALGSTLRGCDGLLSIDLTPIDFSSVTTCTRMCQGCSSATVINVAGIDTGAVENMSFWFIDTAITTSAADGFDIAVTADMTLMYDGVTLGTANYNAIMIAWEGETVNTHLNDVPFGGGTSIATDAGLTARDNLETDHFWVITDSS